MKIENGAVDGKPILKAWENITGDYFFALEDKGGGEYYGLFRSGRNEAVYMTLSKSETCLPQAGAAPAPVADQEARSAVRVVRSRRAVSAVAD